MQDIFQQTTMRGVTNAPSTKLWSINTTTELSMNQNLPSLSREGKVRVIHAACDMAKTAILGKKKKKNIAQNKQAAQKP